MLVFKQTMNDTAVKHNCSNIQFVFISFFDKKWSLVVIYNGLKCNYNDIV